MSAALVALVCADSGSHDADSLSLVSENRTRDAERVARLRAGDEAAFEALFREYVEPLVRYAASYTKDPIAAREIAMEVFATIWKRRETWTPEHGAATYMYGAVRNRALNYERANRRREQLAMRAANEPDPPGLGLSAETEEDEDKTQLIERVRRAVSELPTTRREAMLLRWEHQMTPDQIAHVMGLSRTSVYHLLERSLKTLRELFGRELR